ncbi:sigma-70 family RNA polymerase sigma factor [Luteipulveratus mongoliensis]|uniref:sigma-70 family RNA polymerase sigma factor n=1 Tax=Luteipulveratus mongoliensis TaxID=571913 RepID=UPI00069677E4|nr:sigma-70 family RNA polymerase sigma factor [Luteipulveratus mongoliensis]
MKAALHPISPEQHTLISQAQRSRLREDLDRLDTQRAMVAAIKAGVRQQALAEALGVSQGAVSQRLKIARDASAVPDGFAGASPREIAQRYALGQLDQTTLVRQLTAWPYPPRDDESGDHPWEEVAEAVDRGWITHDEYEQVLLGRGLPLTSAG